MKHFFVFILLFFPFASNMIAASYPTPKSLFAPLEQNPNPGSSLGGSAPMTNPPRNQDLPSFLYVDLELFSVGITTEGYLMASNVILDYFTGSFLLHGRFGGSWMGDVEYFIYEPGIGIVLDADYRTGEAMKQVFMYDTQIGSTIYRTVETHGYRGKALSLLLLDIGMRGYAPYYTEYDYYEVTSEGKNKVFGTTYSNLDEAYIWYYDKIFYFGIRGMHVKEKMFTFSEITWYLWGLVGYTDRTADLYLNGSSTATKVTSRDKVVFGAEAGVRWHMFQAKAGIYDDFFYFTIGYRLGFQFGL